MSDERIKQIASSLCSTPELIYLIEELAKEEFRRDEQGDFIGNAYEVWKQGYLIGEDGRIELDSDQVLARLQAACSLRFPELEFLQWGHSKIPVDNKAPM